VERGDDLLHKGKTTAAIGRLDGDLRAHLELYRQHLESVRRYRRTTGESGRSRRAEWFLFAYYLVPFGRHLSSGGLSSWQQLTPERFREAVTAWGSKPSTRRLYLSSLKTFLEFLRSERRLFRNPLATLNLPALAPLAGARPQEPGRAIALIGDEAVRPTVRAIVALIALHGLAPAEISALRLSDFRPRGRVVVLRKRGRQIQLDPLTFAAVMAYVDERPATPGNTHLFVTDRSAKSGRAGHFVSLLRELGFSPRSLRIGQIQATLAHENAVIVARLFDLSLQQIYRHSRLLGLRQLEQAPLVAGGPS
jgi:integrase